MLAVSRVRCWEPLLGVAVKSRPFVPGAAACMLCFLKSLYVHRGLSTWGRTWLWLQDTADKASKIQTPGGGGGYRGVTCCLQFGDSDILMLRVVLAPCDLGARTRVSRSVLML